MESFDKPYVILTVQGLFLFRVAGRVQAVCTIRSFSALRKRESCQQIMTAVTTVAIRSEAGKQPVTPSRPNFGGSISRSGMRKSTWRVSERKIEAEALPIDWKRVVETI